MRIPLIATIFLSQMVYAQTDATDGEEYDFQIYDYLVQYVDENEIDKSTYLEFTKPFSKWDTRPVDVSETRIMGEIQQSSIITNYFWGSFSKYYGLTVEEAMALPNTFLSAANSEKHEAVEFAKEHEEDLKKLIKEIKKSPHEVVLSQQSLQRVDSVYFENGQYWQYFISNKSPFPMSSSQEYIKNYEYTKSAMNILEQMTDLNLYAIYSRDGLIYLLRDGLLDNSYGYLFTSEEIEKASSHLFKIMYFEQINDDLYYYIAN
ncbi:hypothetical protein O3Q51_05090 [Cryomorphaceae bacterium 1068]|nr:hypothetical protein [Cryomorphaceae bacterium 1068]